MQRYRLTFLKQFSIHSTTKKLKYTGDNANQVLERKITNSVALLLPFFMPFRLSTLECTIFQNKKIIARNIPLKHSS